MPGLVDVSPGGDVAAHGADLQVPGLDALDEGRRRVPEPDPVVAPRPGVAPVDVLDDVAHRSSFDRIRAVS